MVCCLLSWGLYNVFGKRHILVKDIDRNADIDAFQCYLIAWPERMECPEIIACAPIDIYCLLLCAYQDIFLNGGATLVVPELLSPVGRFGRGGKHLNNDTWRRNDIALFFKITRVATD